MKKNTKIINGFIILSCLILMFISSIEMIDAKNLIFILDDGCSVLNTVQKEFLQYVFNAIRIATPILIVILVMKDFLQAVTSQKEDEMKKAQSSAIKRIIIGVVIMFVPTIVNLVLDLIGKGLTTCGL